MYLMPVLLQFILSEPLLAAGVTTLLPHLAGVLGENLVKVWRAAQLPFRLLP
jgi:hypothetical protein